MVKIKEKYYKCPKCGDTTTWTDILEECGSGGAGMCYCEYNNGRILYKWIRISKDKYNDLVYKNMVTKKGLSHSKESLRSSNNI